MASALELNRSAEWNGAIARVFLGAAGLAGGGWQRLLEWFREVVIT